VGSDTPSERAGSAADHAWPWTWASIRQIGNLQLEGNVQGADVVALPGTKQARTEAQLAKAG
jgi:hypothetical protein